MGTPEFAVQSLKALVDGEYNVVGVITMPDKPAGRGHKIQYSAVKQYALAQGLPLLQPESLKNEFFLNRLRALKADLQIVVAFRMLPEVVWNMPKYGTFNLHASLLPRYRGAAPINWAIINGEKETGATTFFLSHEIDTGKIILQKKVAIHGSDNAGVVHDKLMCLGADMVVETVDLILSGNILTVPQEDLIAQGIEPTPAPKIFKEDCLLRTDISVEEAHNFVRGLSPYPAARVSICLPALPEAMEVKVFESAPEKCAHTVLPGATVQEGKRGLKIALSDGFLHLQEIQAPGKKRMKTSDFLNGLQL